MAKNVAVSDDVYQLLVKLRLPGESFSDAIRRLARASRLSEIAGSKTVSKEDWQTVKRAFNRQRLADMERRSKLLAGA